MTLVVMAAGRGSRFGGLKQVTPVGPSGEVLFDYAVYDAVRSGIQDVVLVISEASREAVKHQVDGGCGRHVDVRYVEQRAGDRAKPLGTGHALLRACSVVEDSFGVVNADDFYGRQSFELLASELAADGTDHILVGYRLQDTLSPNGGVSRGLCEVDDGILVSISELYDVAEVDGVLQSRQGLPLTGKELISTNMWGFRPSFCAVLAEEFDRFLSARGDDPSAEFLIGDAVARLRTDGTGRVRVVPTDERFLGMTYVEDVADVSAGIRARVATGEYPTPLWP
jgi:NDP-sugar pyrophosphorylase family protein